MSCTLSTMSLRRVGDVPAGANRPVLNLREQHHVRV